MMRLGDSIYEIDESQDRLKSKSIPSFLAMLCNPEYKMNFIPDYWFDGNINGVSKIRTLLMNSMKKVVEEQKREQQRQQQQGSVSVSKDADENQNKKADNSNTQPNQQSKPTSGYTAK